jgi:hypothetical protein
MKCQVHVKYDIAGIYPAGTNQPAFSAQHTLTDFLLNIFRNTSADKNAKPSEAEFRIVSSAAGGCA